MRSIAFSLLFIGISFVASGQINRITESEINDQDKYIDAISPSLIGEEEEAIKRLEKYISDHPTQDAAFYQLARLYHVLGKERECLDAIEKAVTLEPSVEWYRIVQAQYQEEYEHWRNAAQAYENLLELNPDHSNYWLSAAHAYLNAGDPKKSLSLLNDLEVKIGLQPEISQKKYIIYKSLGQYNEAVNVTRQLIDKFPNRPDYWMILGELYAEMGKKEKEVEVYQKVLALDSSVTEARIRMTELNSGSEGELLQQLMPVVKDPELSIDLKVQKLIPFLQKVDANNEEQSEQLITALEALVSSHPRDAKAYTMLADGYFNTARLRKALTYYEKAEELQPNISTVWMQHIQTLSLLDEHEEVVDLAEKAFAYFPNQVEFYLQAAESALSLDRTEKAREYLESSSFMVGSQQFFKQRFDALAALIAQQEGTEGMPESFIIDQSGYKYIVPQAALLILQHHSVRQQEWLDAVIRQAEGPMKTDFIAQIAAAYAAFELDDPLRALRFLDMSLELGASNYPSVYLLQRKIEKKQGDKTSVEEIEERLQKMGYQLSEKDNG